MADISTNGELVDLDNTTRNIWEIAQEAHGRAITLLSSFFSSIDPNWSRADVSFKEKPAKGLAHANFNGPRFGESSFLRHIERVLPHDLLVLLSELAKREHNWKYLWFGNSNYEIQLIDDKTEIVFENCEVGIVRHFDPEKGTIEIHMSGGPSRNDGQVRRYTKARLAEELAMEYSQHGEAVYIEYLPQSEPGKPSPREVTEEEVTSWLQSQ